MKRTPEVALIAFIGLCAGAGLDEALHAFRQRNIAQSFQQRMRCRRLADEFAKKESSEIEQVDFSPSRNSCVASTLRGRAVQDGDLEWTYQTVDIVTGETLFIRSCYTADAKSPSFCGNGHEMEIISEQDKAFAKALSGK